ncbi:choline dehydrogenase [Thioalkalivibrio sp. HK1]|uniref:choline dehydrogenase n=1 Tax=Thioalkalivibrio sp. HK1 TaxID=1469245 RepID=UPI000472D823|nr:choline dehydrogenase [Thioalkalivibrio sp. HK1]
MQADYIVVGAGSAGCTVAFRLAQAGHSVIVIEYGGSDKSPLIRMPGALSYPMNMPIYDWGYRTEPEPGLKDRRLACPRGKVIGGSSSINGMVYVRGHAKDFDTWEEMGARGWSFADVLPYFKRQEAWESGGHGGDPVWRGTDGPLHVTRGERRNPLTLAFVEAGIQAGYRYTGDYNGHRQEGFGPMDRTIYRGKRWSAANAYLYPALESGRCRIVRGLAQQIIIEKGCARGVRLRQGKSSRTLFADREVILAASSINSPKLLMLSGVGPADHLRSHGIDVVADRPGVGQNLQDHLEVYIQYAAKKPVSLHRYWNPLGKMKVGLQWLANASGPGASNQFESGGFIRSAAGIEYPDIQFHFLPLAVRYDGRSAARGHGFQAHVGPMRSLSRGRVRLRGADPAQDPIIEFNYLSHENDFKDFRNCIRLTREVFAQKAFEDLIDREIQPGISAQSDADIDEFVRNHAESAYHPCGTCRMGYADDPMAVVDPECKVIGISRLRIVDTGIFPRITNGNLNGPAIMVGEKASDHILGKDPLPKIADPPWIHPNWRDCQR